MRVKSFFIPYCCASVSPLFFFFSLSITSLFLSLFLIFYSSFLPCLLPYPFSSLLMISSHQALLAHPLLDLPGQKALRYTYVWECEGKQLSFLQFFLPHSSVKPKLTLLLSCNAASPSINTHIHTHIHSLTHIHTLSLSSRLFL